MANVRTVPPEAVIAPPAPRPQVSVLLVSYNSRAYLADCLDALLAEATPGLEVILFDNCSTDGGAAMVEARYPDVRVVRADENLGFGAANNAAAALAGGGLLVFLNPDTVVAPGWLAPLEAALNAEPEVAMATARIVLHDAPSHLNTAGNSVHISGLALCRGMGRPAESYAEAEEVPAVSGAAFAMRRELFLALGGFDGPFFLYMEDTDLSWRARLAGYTCRYVPGSVVAHHYRLRFGPRKIFYQERNRYLMLLKSLRWPTILALLPALALAEALTWGFVLLRNPAGVAEKLGAYAWIVCHWPDLLRARRCTQSLRRVPDRALIAATAAGLDYAQAGDGLAARLAAALFDPLFAAARAFALAVVRW